MFSLYKTSSVSIKLFISYLVVSFCLFTVNSAIAKPVKTVASCEQKHENLRELSQCLDIVKSHTDKVLQTWINNQTFALEDLAEVTGRNSALKMFKRSQKSFVNYRENNCRWQYLANLPSLEASPAYKKCYILLTNDRINELSQIKNVDLN